MSTLLGIILWAGGFTAGFLAARHLTRNAIRELEYEVYGLTANAELDAHQLRLAQGEW